MLATAILTSATVSLTYTVCRYLRSLLVANHYHMLASGMQHATQDYGANPESGPFADRSVNALIHAYTPGHNPSNPIDLYPASSVGGANDAIS